jgi:general secretion pathway protein L
MQTPGMTTLLIPRAGPALWRLAHRGVRWWLAELTGLVPARLREAFASRGMEAVVMEFGNGAVQLRTAHGSRFGAATIPVNRANEQSVGRLRERFLGSAVRIALSDDVVLRTSLELPEAAEPELAKILPHQLNRLVPMDPKSFSFTWWIGDRIVLRKTLRVVVAVAKNSTLAQARDLSGELGLNATQILVAGPKPDGVAIWRGTSFAANGHARQSLCRSLEVATLCCLIAAYIIYDIKLNTQHHRLEAMQSQLRTQLAAVAGLPRSANRAEEMLTAITKDLSRPTPLAILNDLTRSVPLDASISDLTLKGDKVQIVGVASHATDLIARINGSRLFSDPTFSAPITAFSDNKEHFELNIRLSKDRAR